MVSSTGTAMPARDAARFRKAVADYRAPDAPLPLAAVVLGAHGSGWSYRTIARSLELTRERTMQLAALQTTPYPKVAPYRPGETFPQDVVKEFRRRDRKAAARREEGRAKAAATIKAANDAGWPFWVLASLVDLSDERLRRIALEAPPDLAVRPFTPAPPAVPLAADIASRMAVLARQARSSTKNTGRSLGADASDEERRAAARSVRARKASEELSDLIIAAKNSGVSWAEIEAACGYRPGAARARAVRHGYGSLPPTRRAYQRSATPVDTSA